MAKKAYIGVSNVAKKVKNMYVGVNGIAKKVKKGYVGVNGVARLFFKFGELKKYSQLSATGKGDTEGGTVGNYAIFVGADKYTTGSYNVINNKLAVYNSSLTLTRPEKFANSESDTDAMICNDNTYAYISHGQYIHRLDSSLTQVSPSQALSTTHSDGTIASNGTYVLKAGDYNNPTSVSGYDIETMTYHWVGSLNMPANAGSTYNYYVGSGAIEDYILFAGGCCSYYKIGTNSTTGYQSSNRTTAFDSSLTKSTPSNLTNPSYGMGIVYNGTQLILCGGHDALYTKVGSYSGTWQRDNLLATVNIYNTSLTKSNGNALSVARAHLAGLQMEDYSMFLGGGDSKGYNTSRGSNVTTYVDVYDSSLIHTQDSNIYLSTARRWAGAALAGNYGIVYGGSVDQTEVYIID